MWSRSYSYEDPPLFPPPGQRPTRAVNLSTPPYHIYKLNSIVTRAQPPTERDRDVGPPVAALHYEDHHPFNLDSAGRAESRRRDENYYLNLYLRIVGARSASGNVNGPHANVTSSPQPPNLRCLTWPASQRDPIGDMSFRFFSANIPQ